MRQITPVFTLAHSKAVSLDNLPKLSKPNQRAKHCATFILHESLGQLHDLCMMAPPVKQEPSIVYPLSGALGQALSASYRLFDALGVAGDLGKYCPCFSN